MRKAAVFLGVGGVATLLHVVVAILWREVFQAPPLMANLAGYALAVLVSYMGHTRLTFDVEAVHSFHFPRFFVVSVLGLALSSLITYLGSTFTPLPFAAVMGIVAISVPPLSFALMQFWAFVPVKERGETWLIGLIAAALPAVLTFALFKGQMVNHDTAWYLIGTERWLAGGALYTDVVEVNPPLMFYFTVPAVWLSHLTGLSLSDAQYAFIALLLFGSLSWCWVLINRLTSLSLVRKIVFLFGIAFAAILPAINNMGQREQVFVLMSLPWIIGKLVEAKGTPAQVILRAAIAGLGICLKPYFLLLPIFLTLRDIYRSQSLRPILSLDNIAIFLVGASYVAYVAVVHRAYFSEIIPMAGWIYGEYTFGTSYMLSRFTSLPSLIAYCLVALCLPLARLAPNGGVLAAASLAGVGAYLIQSTGFSYQILPAEIFAILFVLWTLVQPGHGLRTRVIGPVFFGFLAVVGLIRGPYYSYRAHDIAEAVQGGNGFVTLSSDVPFGANPALLSGTPWASRYPALWLVPGVINGRARTNCAVEPEACAAYAEIDAFARRTTIEDIATYAPDFIVVDKNSGFFIERPFDWIAYFSQDPEFVSLFADYHLKAEGSQFYVYEKGAKP